ncbi:LUD domain-containing protein [Parabacteroides merdae]|uniref:LutC/YkgG family protein n=1 Tax=Parabacteroides merdae TaxID=46503 RepID=UPI00189BADB6|nr:LUD domain-containing protein [Parabacteroides merdae]MDB9115767.1 LUD domain-containing protein [Parabacteroides merdae]
MSSKNDILSAIRRHTGKRYDMPELTLDAITYEDKILQFTDSLKAAGGQVVLMQLGDDINDIIRHHFPDAIRIASNLSSITCATFNPDDLDDPRELDNTDLAIVEGHFGVAENGAVWITSQVKHKALYFISNSLVMLIDRNSIVNNMHEAYKRTENMTYDFGAFISGPSKTADIEQALVLGAHGPVKVLVVLK